MSSFAAFAIRASGAKKRYADPVRRTAYIEKLRKKSEQPFHLPPFPFRAETETRRENGVEVLYFNRGAKKKLIYLHGGAYCEPPLLPHFMLCDRISAETGYEIAFPLYKRAPDHTFVEAYAFLESYYRRLLETVRPENIVLMGDSAGGGLALAFCQYLNEIRLQQPARMILLSPWVDVSMDTPFPAALDRVDPNLQYDFLKIAGQNWAGEYDVHDYRVSPVYGNLKNLAPMTVYYGTHENLLPDARIFKKKCEAAGADLDYREYENMNHVFVVYPIPEAKKAQNEIIALLKARAKTERTSV